MILFRYTFLSGFLLWVSHLFAQQPINVTRFNVGSLVGWQSKSFSGNNHYQIVELGGRLVLKAESVHAASGLVKEIKIDLKRTPYINWSWRIENTLPHLNETTLQGDDYAARIYIVKSGGWQVWNTRALNYVWSSNQPAGSRWDNAFVGDKAKMLAVRGLQDHTGQWFSEKRNVYQDLINMFGDKGSDKRNEKAYRFIDGVAIMTDTDNSFTSATAYYGEIYFSAH